MQTKTYTFVDKSTWGDGPWQSEPDKVQWPDPTTGLPCLAVRHPESGHWCGYVGVTDEHPASGKDYDDVRVSVHGGLTYSDYCQPDTKRGEHGICHIPDAGEPEHVYWLGFDCAHSGDKSPGVDAMIHSFLVIDSDVYRTLEYVQAECADLALQLLALREVPHAPN